MKDCPEGTKLYSTLFGDVELKEIDTSKVYSVNVKLTSGLIESFTREGKLYDSDHYKDAECLLFPSKEQRDWSKFKVNKFKFDPNTLQPFDKVIARNFNDQIKNDNLRIIVPKSIWISVKEKLPYNNPNFIHFGFTNKVLVREKNGNVFVAYMKKNKDNEWIWCNDMDDNFNLLSDITHWMHIPAAPKE